MRLAVAAASLLLLAAPIAPDEGGSRSGRAATASDPRESFQQDLYSDPVRPGHAFYFTRAAYTDFRRGGRGGFGSWATDYPKADEQFLVVLKRLTRVDAYEHHNAVRLDDPKIRRFPVIYTVEVGGMAMTESEVKGLRGYLLAGGLLIIDDFWGPQQYQNFEMQMARVLPEYRIAELPREHAIRRNVYRIDEVLSVPNIYRGRMGLDPAECEECRPGRLMGISDDRGRLLVLISFNSDLGDAWEWAEQPDYPLPYSNYAFRLGVNWVVFGMTN